MTPARTSGDSGNLEMDLRFKGAGRIRRSLGTSSAREFKARIAILRKLERQGKFDILRAFKAKRISMAQLIEADDNDQLGLTMSSVAISDNVWKAINRILPSMLPKKVDTARYEKRKKTVGRYLVSLKAFQKKAIALGYLTNKSTVGDLLSLPWDDLYDEWGAGDTDWMHMREAVSVFLSHLLNDKFHPFARQVRSKIPVKKIKIKKVGVAFDNFLKIVKQTPEHAAPSYWTIFLTGMRKGEYLRCNETHLHPDRYVLDVPGTKTDGSSAPQKIDPRIWPIVAAGIPSKLQYRMLREHWNRACVEVGLAKYVPSDNPRFKSKQQYVGPTLHWLRHAAGQLARTQGVAEEKVQDFMRHEGIEMTRGYLMLENTGEVSKAIADAIEQASKPKKSSKRA